MKRNGQEGSTSIIVLALLLFCAAVAAGGVLMIQAALSGERRSGKTYESRKALETETERVIALLANDSTPESDAPTDAIWGEIQAPSLEGCAIQLKDVSSALNPNWVQKNVFMKTGLKSLLVGDSAVDALQQRREDMGFSMDLAATYADLFAEKALETYCTAYGYPNINTTDEFVLRSLYAVRTGDAAGAEAFHGKIQGLLQQQKILKSDQVRDFLGIDYERLFPIMNVEPSMNAHFMNPHVLRELLAYPDLKVPKPAASAAAILDARDGTELSTAALKGFIGAPDDSRIYQYLGVNTWFWRITVSRGAASTETVVARIPAAKDSPRRYMIVEQRSLP
jgi:hypothetical protein